MSYEQVTDSAGVTVEYRPLGKLMPGDKIAGGWRPWAKVKNIELDEWGEKGRVFYEEGGPTEWIPSVTSFPVIVFDPVEKEAKPDPKNLELLLGRLGGIVAVLVDAEWSDEKIVREVQAMIDAERRET